MTLTTAASTDLPRRPRTATPSDFTALAARIQAAGLLRRRHGYYWAKLIVLPALLVATLALFVVVGDTWWQLFTAAALAVLFTQTAFLAHDAAHRQMFASGRWNDWVSLVVGDLLIGMSYGWWRHKHTRHHANPNKEGSDPDIELPIVVATPARGGRRRHRLTSWLLAHQGLFFFPILPLLGVSLHLESVKRVLRREHVDRRWIEIAFLTIRLVGFVALVFAVLSPGIAAVFLVVQVGLFGVYMGSSFAPNHKGMPIVPATAKVDFLRRQVLMSRNIRGGRFTDTLMGGLNYQIEHHLFPSMPRPHLRHAAPIVRAYCEDIGVRYTETGLFASYAIVLRYIDRAGLGDRDPFDCPLVAQRRSL